MNRLLSIAASKACDETPEMKFLDKFFESLSINFAATFWCLLDASGSSSDGATLQSTCINILRMVPSALSGPGHHNHERDRAMQFISNALLKEQLQCSTPAELLRSSKSHVKFTTAWLKEVSMPWFSEILEPVRALADSLQCEWQVDPSRSTSPESAQHSVDCVKQVVSLIVSRLCGEMSSDQKLAPPPPIPSEVARFCKMLAQSIRKIEGKHGSLNSHMDLLVPPVQVDMPQVQHAESTFVARSKWTAALGKISAISHGISAMKDDAASTEITPVSLLIQRILVPQLVAGLAPPVSSDVLDDLRATTVLQATRNFRRSSGGGTGRPSMGPASTPISANLRRALLLCSKVLSNVASGSPFGSKETFMQVFNDFISEQSQLLSTKMFDESAPPSHADLEALRLLELESLRSSSSQQEKEDTTKLHEYLVECIHFLQGIFENNFLEMQTALISASATWPISEQHEIGWAFRRTYFSLMEFKVKELTRTCDEMRRRIKVSNKFIITQGRTYKDVFDGSEAVEVLTSICKGNTKAALEVGMHFIRHDLVQHLHHENVFVEGQEFRFKKALWLPHPYPEAIHNDWCWVRHPGTRHESPKWKHRYVVLEVIVDDSVFPPAVRFFVNCYKDRKPTRRGKPENSIELIDCVARKCVWNLPLAPPTSEIRATSAAANSHTWEIACHGLPPLILAALSASTTKFWIHIVNSVAVIASQNRNASASLCSGVQQQFVYNRKRSDRGDFISGDSISILDVVHNDVSQDSSIQTGSKTIPLKTIQPPISHPNCPEVSVYPANYFDRAPQDRPQPEILSFASVFEKMRFMNKMNRHFYKDARPLKLSVMTWNAGCTRPAHNFPAIVSTGPDVDIWVFGMQECLYDPVPPSKTCEADWINLLKEALSAHEEFVLVTTVSLWQIRIAVLVRASVRHFVSDVSTSTVATGFAGIVKNKGASAVSMVINGIKCLFICSHLAARPERVTQRKTMTADILKGLKLPSPSGGDLFPEAAFGHIFWFGDLNYRVDLPFEQCIAHVEQTNPPLIAPLYETDQLRTARYLGETLASFHEQTINFTPTYRLEPGTANYGNKRGQSPSWCDRVLVRSKPGHAITHCSYDAHVPTMLSDHRPVLAQLVLPCSHFDVAAESDATYEVAFQRLSMSLTSLPPTANGAPPGKPFIRIYLSCGSLPQHAPADDAKFAEIHEGYDKFDPASPEDQMFLPQGSAARQDRSSSISIASPEQAIARGSGSSSVSPHLMAESGLMIDPPALVTATLMKRAMLMNQKLGDKGAGALILSADIDSRRASVLPQALQDKVDSLRKGSGHMFVGQLSWKEEGSIPIITATAVSATQFTNSCITITLHDALSSAEDPPVLALVELPITFAKAGASAEGSSFRTVKAPVELLSSHIGQCSATYVCRPSEARRRVMLTGLDPSIQQHINPC